jgi:hypothetical protein
MLHVIDKTRAESKSRDLLSMSNPNIPSTTEPTYKLCYQWFATPKFLAAITKEGKSNSVGTALSKSRSLPIFTFWILSLSLQTLLLSSLRPFSFI